MSFSKQRHFHYGLTRAQRQREYDLAEEDAKMPDVRTAAGFAPEMQIFGYYAQDSKSTFIGQGRINGARIGVYMHLGEDGSKKFVVSSNQTAYNGGTYIASGHLDSDDQGKLMRFKFDDIAVHIELRLGKHFNERWAKHVGLLEISDQQAAA